MLETAEVIAEVGRPELRLIIASATVDAEAFRAFFETNRTADAAQDTASIISLAGGGVHEVAMHFAPTAFVRRWHDCQSSGGLRCSIMSWRDHCLQTLVTASS